MKKLYEHLKEEYDLDLTKKELETIVKLAVPKKQKFDFRQALLEYGFEEELVDEWLLIRKAKRGVNTKYALKTFLKEVERKGIDKNDLLEIICTKQWAGYNHKWDISDSIKDYGKGKQDRVSEDFKRAILRDLQTGGGL